MTERNRKQIKSIVQDYIIHYREAVADSSADDLLDDTVHALSLFVTTGGVDESELTAFVKELLPTDYHVAFEKEWADRLEPYHQLAFLRSFDEAQQADILRAVFDDMLCHTGDLCKSLSITNEQYSDTLMLVRAVLRIIVGERCALEYTKRLVREMTGLSVGVSDAFVNLFDCNNEVLWNILLYTRISRLERKLEPIIEFMDEIRERTNIDE